MGDAGASLGVRKEVDLLQKLQYYIEGTIPSFSEFDLDRLVSLGVKDGARAVFEVGISRGKVDPSHLLTLVAGYYRDEQSLMLMALCLRAGAGADIYIRTPRDEEAHYLLGYLAEQYLERAGTSEAQDTVNEDGLLLLRRAVILLCYCGANPGRQRKDINNGLSLTVSSVHSLSDETVFEWSRRVGLSTVFEGIVIPLTPEAVFGLDMSGSGSNRWNEMLLVLTGDTSLAIGSVSEEVILKAVVAGSDHQVSRDIPSSGTPSSPSGSVAHSPSRSTNEEKREVLHPSLALGVPREGGELRRSGTSHTPQPMKKELMSIAPSPSKRRGMDYSLILNSLDNYNVHSFRWCLELGCELSYPLVNAILLRLGSLRRNGQAVLKSLQMQLVISMLEHGTILDGEQYQLAVDSAGNEGEVIVRTYQRPYWEKVCTRRGGTVPIRLAALATSLELGNFESSEGDGGSEASTPGVGGSLTSLCGRMKALTPLTDEQMVSLATSRREKQFNVKHAYLDELQEEKVLKCVHLTEQDIQHFTFTSLGTASYRDDNGQIWCYISSSYQRLLESGTNPVTLQPLPHSLLNEIRYKYETLQLMDLDPQHPLTFRILTEKLRGRDLPEEGSTEHALLLLRLALVRRGMELEQLHALPLSSLERAVRTSGISVNLTSLTRSHAYRTLAHVHMWLHQLGVRGNSRVVSELGVAVEGSIPPNPDVVLVNELVKEGGFLISGGGTPSLLPVGEVTSHTSAKK